ncbi:MAG TPA: molybdate ABC transporter substrate-binding protein [Acidimicrobiia bacterium]|nr:molybdate ABC transporter substrate-binding protein [Acidimicrobiia bacterium]
MARCPRRFVRALAVVAVVASGCSSDGGRAGTVRVFAAASLSDAFTEMGATFEAAVPGIDVSFSFAASSTLARQIDEGGPADVFVSADESAMRTVTDGGNATGPRTVARNRLAILVEKGNPKGITGLASLGDPGVLFTLCAPEVPCGAIGAAALAQAGISAEPASLEENVRAVVSKVTLGEADAGIVYVTDVRAAGDKAQGVPIDIADDPSLEAVYRIAVTTASTNEVAARAWVDHVLSEAGQATLARYGFLAP